MQAGFCTFFGPPRSSARPPSVAVLARCCVLAVQTDVWSLFRFNSSQVNFEAADGC